MPVSRPLGNHSSIDLDKINDLKTILGGELAEIMNDFRTILPQILASMEKAVSQNDIERLFQDAHELKSSSGNIGFSRISELCAVLEHQARNNEVIEPAKQIAIIRDEYTNASILADTAIKG